MHAGYARSLLGAPDLFVPSTDEGLVNIQRAINPRFRGVSVDDAPGHRSQLSLRQRKDLMERAGGGGHNVVAKRNARERTRVHTVNKAFHILKQRLPALRIHSKRVSKLRILKAAIVYINNLLDTINSVRSFFKDTALDTALPYIKSFIDYAPYMPQAVFMNSILGSTVGVTPSSVAPSILPQPNLNFSSILSNAAASIGYSNPWTS
ncbi:hypothetical protein PMAYCL1PPCAC_10947, partial [Pristionchus mayeri]